MFPEKTLYHSNVFFLRGIDPTQVSKGNFVRKKFSLGNCRKLCMRHQVFSVTLSASKVLQETLSATQVSVENFASETSFCWKLCFWNKFLQETLLRTPVSIGHFVCNTNVYKKICLSHKFLQKTLYANEVSIESFVCEYKFSQKTLSSNTSFYNQSCN